MASGSRHQARVVALQALYEADSSPHAAPEALERIARQERVSGEYAEFARALVEGVLERRDEIDGIIERAAPAFPVEQLSPIDRNILRLAIRELLVDNETPVRAVINEAVELAKQYGSENSAKFVNGVLGSVSGKLARS
jgi:N utilization substance protein B